MFRIGEVLHDLTLPAVPDGSIAEERGQHLLVSQVLAPRLEILGRPVELRIRKMGASGPTYREVCPTVFGVAFSWMRAPAKRLVIP